MHEFVDETFKVEYTFENILSIQVSLNGFSFSIVSPSNYNLLYFKKTSVKISSENLIARRFGEWYTEQEILKNPFKKTRVCIFSDIFTLIPNNLYEAESKREISRILFKGNDEIHFAENQVDSLNAKLIFGLPNGFNETIQSEIGQCRIVHPAKQLLKTVNGKTKNNHVVVIYNGNSFYLFIFKDSQLVMLNAFAFNHVNDVVYYLLSSLKQYNLSKEDVTLETTGYTLDEKALSTILKKYFPNHQQVKPTVKLPEEFSHQTIAENISLFL